MARQLRRAARDTGQVIAAHEGLVRVIYAWERGDRQLTERYELLYATALSIEPDQLVRGPDGSRGPDDAVGDEPVTRAMLPVTGEDGYPGRLDHVLTHPEITDLIAVAQLREYVRRLDERYDSSPASALIAEAGRRLGQIEFLAAHARRSDVRRELRGAEAEAAVLMGQFVWDASQRRAQDVAATTSRLPIAA